MKRRTTTSGKASGARRSKTPKLKRQTAAAVARHGRASDADLQDRWQLVFETSALGISLTDHNLKFIEANPTFRTMLGYSIDELRNISPAGLLAEEERESGMARMLELREGKRGNYEVVTRYRRKDGTFIWVNTFVSTIRGKKSDLPIFLATAIDITARYRAENELRRSASYLAEAEKLSHTGCWARNIKTGELFWSQEEWRIFGLDPATTNLSYQLFLDLVHPEDRASLEEASIRAVNQKKPTTSHFAQCCATVRLSTFIAWANRSSRNSGEEMVEYIGVTMDETERVRANAAAQEAQAELARVARLTAMGELAASIAHEVNQPLAAVVAHSSAALRWLAHAPPNLNEAELALRHITKEASRASEVVGRIRSFLMYREPEFIGLDINAVIREVLELTFSSLKASNVTIQTSTPAELPPILGDRVQLQQLIMNSHYEWRRRHEVRHGQAPKLAYQIAAR